MVRVVDGKVTVRPLAGTRRRGATDEEDAALAAELLADPKERAEHVMLVDLGRNDVGRVAKFGTVELSDVMVVERYSHVMHITSNVTGQLRDDCDAFDALAACLPVRSTSNSRTTASAARTWRRSTAIAATACAARWCSTTAATRPPRCSSPATSTGTRSSPAACAGSIAAASSRRCRRRRRR